MAKGKHTKINPAETFPEVEKIPLPDELNADLAESVSATITPTQEQKNEDFNTIRQGVETNALTKLRADEHMTVDKMETATIEKGGVKLSIPNYNTLKGLRSSTFQLLDALTIILTESGAKSPTVILTVNDYIKRRGLKDRKEARKQLVSDLDCLLKFNCTWTEKKGKIEEPYAGMNITDSWIWADKKKTAVLFTFSSSFFNILLGYNIMPYPVQLQRINNHNNPYSFSLGRKITELKNMNVGKENENIISVKTLLESSGIPSYEKVMSTSRALTRDIIEPFERDMNCLEDLGMFHWEYCHSKGKPLTDEELENMSYKVFINLLICIEWLNYPDQTARLERRAELIAKAKKKKRATSKKKKTEEE